MEFYELLKWLVILAEVITVIVGMLMLTRYVFL